MEERRVGGGEGRRGVRRGDRDAAEDKEEFLLGPNEERVTIEGRVKGRDKRPKIIKTIAQRLKAPRRTHSTNLAQEKSSIGLQILHIDLHQI